MSRSEHDGHTPDRHEGVEPAAGHVGDDNLSPESIPDPDQPDATESRMPRSEPDEALAPTSEDGLSTGAARWIAVVGSIVSILIVVALVVAAAT